MKKWCIFLFNSFLVFVLSAAGGFSQPANVLRAGATVNVSDTVVFRLNDYVGEHIKWQFSHNLSDWTDIPGATTDSLMFVADTTTHFRAKVIAGDCDPFFSGILKVEVIHQDDQGIVVDIDGNVYPTVIIGNQRWMSQNLRVTRYTNGNLIPTGLSHSEWHGTTSGAYAIYSIGQEGDDDIDPPEEMAEAYGKLYNWYAVDDARGLCPAGWRVPSDDDWTELVNYVIDQGFPNINTSNGTGNALKSCRQVGSPLGDHCDTSEHPRWNYPHNHHYGFDEFGFSALPGGMWGDDIGLLGDAWGYGLGLKGHWWSATAFGSTTARYRAIASWTSTIARSYTGKNDGFSVRCVRDLKEFSLNLDTDPESAGSVTGAGNHLEGAHVDIIAAAFAGWEFARWTGDIDYVDDPTSVNATVTMPAKTITLTANFHLQEDPGTVTDIDGNVYNIILVDDQKWLVENLRVTRYNNGDSIPTGLNDSQWSSTSSGAYAIFDHNDSNADGIDSPEEMVTAYGKLYNWWAVDDPRGLCPEGWRAPSDDESKAMEMFLGMDVDEVHNSGWRGVDEGGKLKSLRTEPERHPRWNQPNTLASDEIRFSLFPSGFREHHGAYTSLGQASLYWTSTTNAGVSAWYRTHSTELGTIGRFFGWNNYGFSVRCVKESVTYNLQLDYSPINAGGVSGAGEYIEGKEVNIEAFSNPGWRFLEWTGDTDYLVDPTAPNNAVIMPSYDISLTANFIEGSIIYGDGVTDIEGNDYVTVVIGEREWMAANLRVTKYKNGDQITSLRNIGEQKNSEEGVYAIYPHDNVSGIDSPEEMAAAYGLLYNWHAVNDARGVCPEGWHAPTNEEWIELVNYVEAQGYPNDFGSFNNAGNALKSCRQVASPLDDGCNTFVHPRWNPDGSHYGFDEFGFSALPGGGTWSDDNFLTLGVSGFWWTTTQHSSTTAWMHYMSTYSGKVSRGYTNTSRALSLRCIKSPSAP